MHDFAFVDRRRRTRRRRKRRRRRRRNRMTKTFENDMERRKIHSERIEEKSHLKYEYKMSF